MLGVPKEKGGKEELGAEDFVGWFDESDVRFGLRMAVETNRTVEPEPLPFLYPSGRRDG